jgi:formiminoglutamate deiminase
MDPLQQRFSDGVVGGWMARAEKVAAANPDVVVGAAIHSVRAIDPSSIEAVADWARQRAVPLHLHLSEQPAENDACVAATGRTPTQLAHDHGVLGPSTTAVHCIHVTDDDVELLASTGTAVCVCPTTERDLGDGIAPAARLARAGCRLRVGTDSHAMVDLFEEVRAIELDERLASGRRGLHDPHALLAAATAANDAERSGDRCAVDLDSVRLAGADPADPVPMIVAAATAADVTEVVVAGRTMVRDGAHVSIDVATELRAAIDALR